MPNWGLAFATCLVHQVLPTARGVPGWSPIQVLTPRDGAWLRWSYGNRYVTAAWPCRRSEDIRISDIRISSYPDIWLRVNAGLDGHQVQSLLHNALHFSGIQASVTQTFSFQTHRGWMPSCLKMAVPECWVLNRIVSGDCAYMSSFTPFCHQVQSFYGQSLVASTNGFHI